MALIKPSVTPQNDQHARKNERDVNGLAKQLESVDSEARRWAARDLAIFPGTSCLLVNRLKVEEDRSVREIILTSLTILGDPKAVAGLVECMRSEDASLRNEAIEAMKQLPEVVSPIMRSLLDDGDSDLRIFAVNILESLRHPEVENWLTDVIERDAHINVCATAVDLLGEVGSKAALEPLKRLKSRFGGEPYIQFAADLAIKRILEG